MKGIRTRALAVCASMALALVGVVGANVPAVAHSYTCWTGNSNYVAIVFEHGDEDAYTGKKDDLCWKTGHSRDDEFSVNESGVDDIGENANFHDKVSSISLINNGSSKLCIKFYHDANRNNYAYSVLLNSGYGDYHDPQVPHNDSYDSMDLTHQGTSGCYGP